MGPRGQTRAQVSALCQARLRHNQVPSIEDRILRALRRLLRSDSLADIARSHPQGASMSSQEGSREVAVTKSVHDSDSITTLEQRPETSEEIEVSFAWVIKKVFPDSSKKLKRNQGREELCVGIIPCFVFALLSFVAFYVECYMLQSYCTLYTLIDSSI
jgi:hypothetical protein